MSSPARPTAGARADAGPGEAAAGSAGFRATGRLQLTRLGADDLPADAAQALGLLLYGLPDAVSPDVGADDAVTPVRSVVPAPLLHGAAAVDLLAGGGVRDQGRCGRVAWRHDGHRLFGHATMSEGELPAAIDGETPLEAVARLVYEDVFATLEATGFPHFQRLWNYVPRINEHSHGLERYRQFNSGRQRAFLAAGSAAFVGAPAACGLGAQGEALRVSFLAARVPSQPVENPRQVSAYHYPREFGPRSPTFSRAALSDVGDDRIALFVSGTASIVGHQSKHAGDVVAQTRETVANLRAVVGAADGRCGAGFRVEDLQAVIYVRDPADRTAVEATLVDELGAGAPLLRHAVWLQADVCRRELLIEIEGHAERPGRLPVADEAPSSAAEVASSRPVATEPAA